MDNPSKPYWAIKFVGDGHFLRKTGAGPIIFDGHSEAIAECSRLNRNLYQANELEVVEVRLEFSDGVSMKFEDHLPNPGR